MSAAHKFVPVFVQAVMICLLPALSVADQFHPTPQVSDAGSESAEMIGLRSRLADEPTDVTARATLARLLSQDGRYDEALGEYEQLIAAYPNDVDHSLARAQVLSWMGQDREALNELERAKNLAPDYEDVWRLQFALLGRQHDAASESALIVLRDDAIARFPEATWTTAPGSVKSIEWELTVGAAYEQLSKDLPDWNNQYVQLDWIRNSDERYFGRIARDARFDSSDQQFALGGNWRVLQDWNWGAEINASPSADFQPESGFALHAGRSLGRDWIADASFRQRRYTNAIVSTYGGALQRYFGNYRAAYGLNVSHLHGLGNSLAHTLSIDWYMTEQDSLRLTVADGEEAEAVGAGQVLETPVTSLTLSGRHAFNDRVALSWWTGTHRQGSYYRRSYVGLALTVGL